MGLMTYVSKKQLTNLSGDVAMYHCKSEGEAGLIRVATDAGRTEIPRGPHEGVETGGSCSQSAAS